MLLILENLGIVESVGRTVSWVRSPSESVGITESVMRYFLRTISLTETVLVTETIAFMKIFNRTYSDVVSIIEHVRFPLNWLKRVVPTSVWTPRTPPSSTDWHPRVKP
jgi:hypothetical protein